MLGVIVATHGSFAEGIISSVKLIFGDVEQLEPVMLEPAMGPDDLKEILYEKAKQVDTGDGVVVIADLLGGTPANVSAYLTQEGIQVITGLNLPMLLELLGARLGGSVDYNQIIETGKMGIQNLNELLGGN